MANNKDNTAEDSDILQHLSAAHLQYQMARERGPVAESRAGTSDQADSAKEVGLDWTHPQEASIQHHTPSTDLEPARKDEERSATQQLQSRAGVRAEEAGNQLDRTGQSSPEQSAMAKDRRWPMLRRERWA